MGEELEIGSIGNYYGSLTVRMDEFGDCFWSIENWDGHSWERIPRSLYDELVKFENEGVA